MILCDIGNSFLHFYYHGKVWRESKDNLSVKDSKEIIIFISVNEELTKTLLYSHASCFDLTPFLSLDTNYKGLGVDRIAACKAIKDGVIVDAGSAITIDVMQQDIHLGGYILPGIAQYKKVLGLIPILDCEMNLGVSVDTFPQNTRDAVSFGMLKSILLMIENTSKSKKIYFTGGDGKFLSRFFVNCIYDELLVFKGMQKVITEEITSKGIVL